MIGAMNIHAILLGAVLQSDGGGGFAAGWQPLGSLWLKLAVQSTAQKYDGDGVATQITYRATVRRRHDITAGMRLQADRGIFDIVAVEDCGTDTLTLLCEVRA